MTFLTGARAERFEAMLAPLRTALGGEGLDQRLLDERARRMGLVSAGRRSANGSCRLVRAADDWVALNLARSEDVELVPALIGSKPHGDPWEAVEAAKLPAVTLVERATLLGLPLTRRGECKRPAAIVPHRTRGQPARAPRILDLSALWAGPLCAMLLGRLGGPVLRIENGRRPDRSRTADAGFFATLNAGKAGRTIDLPKDSGLLAEAIAEADIVVESSRPRALLGLGIDARRIVDERPGLIWLSITAHGRAGEATRVGFGDDAAVAGGLVDDPPDEAPAFVGDAIADPLAGIAAARAALTLLDQGEGGLVDIAMAGAAAEIAGTA